MKHLLFLILLAFFCLATLSSCNKNLNTQNVTKVEGTALQKETLVPVENAAVVFYQDYSKGGIGGIVEFPIDTVYTDSSGSFTWETDIDPYNSTYESTGGFFIKTIYAEKYFDVSQAKIIAQGNETNFNYLDNEILEIKMPPKSYISVSVKNVANPPTDFLRYHVDNFVIVDEFNGETKSNIHKLPGFTDYNLKLSYDINSGSTEQIPFNVSAFDTLLIEVEY